MKIANDNSKANYNVGNEIIYNKEVLKSNFCGYSDAYILVKGNISVTAAPITPANFKNSAPITKCLTKINGATIDDAENLDFVMSVYNLIEYSSNYSEKQELYGFIESTNFNNNISNTNNYKSFKYKTKLLENIFAQPNLDHANGILKNVTTAVSLKCFSNF